MRIPWRKSRNDRFRYAQPVTESKLAFMGMRNPYGYLLTRGLVKDALGKGWVLKEEEEEIKETIRYQSEMKPYRNFIQNGISYELEQGKALFIVFAPELGKPAMLRVFNKQDYTVKYDARGEIIEVVAHEIIDGGVSKTHTITDKKKLEHVFELIIRPGRDTGSGISFLSAVYDQLYSLAILDANGTYFAIRVGGGLKVVRVSAANAKNAKYMASLNETMGQMDSENGVITLIEETIPGVKSSGSPLELLSGDQIDFLAIRDLILGSVSVATRIPREVFLGSELGLRSSDNNKNKYFATLQDLQVDYDHLILWVSNILNKYFKWYDETKILTVEYTTRVIPTEEEELNILQQKADIIDKLKSNMDINKLGEMLNLKLIESEPLDLEGTEDTEEDTEETEDDNLPEEE